MKPQIIARFMVDVGMTVLLMILMAFELIGRAAHEWIGLGMFVLFLTHHYLNRKWSANIFRGKYGPYRVLQTVCSIMVCATMIGSMFSAVLISREVFAFLPTSGGRSLGRMLHMLCAYWGFILMSYHLGLHWSTMMGLAGRFDKTKFKCRRWPLRVAGCIIAVYGAVALIRRSIPRYLFLQSQFVYFDFEEPLVLFFLDYLAIMGLFIFMGHYTAKAARRLSRS
ncbi:DUF4405 domain-containing protein [Subdoligranulum variabile]|uniref:DUF4405 domain-containing protein n=1 Tax=Subdoligranulum variabile TaxID=214851 RepID=UPI0029434F7E|nr:DUF4405 domain-containing protein [Subdoligranulum variabile]